MDLELHPDGTHDLRFRHNSRCKAGLLCQLFGTHDHGGGSIHEVKHHSPPQPQNVRTSGTAAKCPTRTMAERKGKPWSARINKELESTIVV